MRESQLNEILDLKGEIENFAKDANGIFTINELYKKLNCWTLRRQSIKKLLREIPGCREVQKEEYCYGDLNHQQFLKDREECDSLLDSQTMLETWEGDCYCKDLDVGYGCALVIPDGLKVLEGSTVSRNQTQYFNQINYLEELGVIKDNIFVRSYIFIEPEIAAKIILGSTCDSQFCWRKGKYDGEPRELYQEQKENTIKLEEIEDNIPQIVTNKVYYKQYEYTGETINSSYSKQKCINESMATENMVLAKKYKIDENKFKNVLISDMIIKKRLKNIFKRNNINTIYDILVLSMQEMYSYRNFGKECEHDIIELIHYIEKGDIEKLIIKQSEDLAIDDSITFAGLFEVYAEDYNLVGFEEFEFSVRLRNCLKSEGVICVGELLNYTAQNLHNIKNMGKRSIKELYEKVLNQYAIEKITEDNGIKGLISNYGANNLQEKRELQIETLFETVDQDRRQHLVISYINAFTGNENQRDLLKGIIKYEATVNELLKLNFAKLTPIEYSALLDFAKWLSIDINEEIKIFFAHLYGDERKKYILQMRIIGKTLNEIGTELEISRERVRQLDSKILDQFILWNNSKRIFQIICAIKNKDKIIKIEEIRSEVTYNAEGFIFLLLRQGNTEEYVYNKELEVFIVNEDTISFARKYNISDMADKLSGDNANSANCYVFSELQKIAYKKIHKDYILIGNQNVEPTKLGIIEYILKVFKGQELTLDEAYMLYQEILSEYNLINDTKLAFSEKTFERVLAERKDVLWKFGRKLRYYDTNAIEAIELIINIGIIELENVEISAYKLFRDNSELMDEWDIRDEYELHNLMKKVVGEENVYGVKFKRMPIIEIGKGNREQQVVDLLFEYAPIEYNEFVLLHEEKYGVRAATAKGTYFGCIEKYLHEGIYEIETIQLDEEQITRLSQELTKKIYTIKQLKNVFYQIFSDEEHKLINAFNIKTLGFKLHNEIAYKSENNNFDRFLKNWILEKDFFDATKLERDILNCTSYYLAIRSLLMQYQIVEFLPKRYITINKLKENRITIEALRDFTNRVWEFIETEIFTVTLLRRKGFTFGFEEYGFEETFYESLIQSEQRFRSNRVSGTLIFKRGIEAISIKELIEKYIMNLGKINIYDLIYELKLQFGICMERHKLIGLSNDCNFYYNDTMETIYIDYEEYLEEV